MNHTFQRLMQQATRLTTVGQLRAATTAIQRALRGGATHTRSAQTAETATAAMPQGSAPTASAKPEGIVLDGFVIEVPDHAGTAGSVGSVGSVDGAPPVPGKEVFTEGKHTHAALTRQYKLYVPATTAEGAGRPRALVVMLHGCTQDPDDFAAGTGMNERAREQGFLVLYPAQAQDANPSRCWNWFKHNHHLRDRGEAAVIATMTQAVMKAHGINPAQVYIAGLSAGGAMAAIVASAYPELFAAVGVHSGLAPGAARNLPEGLAAMRSGAGGHMDFSGHNGPSLRVPAIVFHGDRDATVNPKNADQVIAAALAGVPQPASGATRQPVVEQGISQQGQRYTRTVHGTVAGPARAEQWVLHGAGHAWSGGQAAGSYTDAKGPDASREMLRFFFSQSANPGY